MKARRPRDAGETLIEILISITIMGLGVVALLSAMGTAATTSGLHARQAGEVQGIQSFVQAVQDAPYVTGCPTSYAPAGYTDPFGYTLTASVTGYATGTNFSTTCLTPDQGVQRVQVKIHQNDGRVRDELFVMYKRNPCDTSAALAAC